MKILVDENIPRLTVEYLLQLGHDVLDVRGTVREGSTDEELWLLAQEQSRLVISTDKFFVDVRTESHFGILLVTLRQPNRKKIHQRVVQALMEHQRLDWKGKLVTYKDQSSMLWPRQDL